MLRMNEEYESDHSDKLGSIEPIHKQFFLAVKLCEFKVFDACYMNMLEYYYVIIFEICIKQLYFCRYFALFQFPSVLLQLADCEFVL